MKRSWIGIVGLLALVAACVPAALVMAWMKRTFGGMTGDLLGLTSEIVETCVVVGLAAAG
jgi:cobalamin synthase